MRMPNGTPSLQRTHHFPRVTHRERGTEGICGGTVNRTAFLKATEWFKLDWAALLFDPWGSEWRQRPAPSVSTGGTFSLCAARREHFWQLWITAHWQGPSVPWTWWSFLFKTALWATFLHCKPAAFSLKPCVCVKKITKYIALLGAIATVRCSCIAKGRFRNQGRINVKLRTVQEQFLLDSLQHRLGFFSIFTWFIVFLCKGLRKSLVDKCPGNTNVKIYSRSYFSSHFLQAESCGHKKGTLHRLLCACKGIRSEAGVRWEKPVIKRERLRTSWKAVNIIKTWKGECQMD